MITATNESNMQMMKRYEDNHFDIAIVDPPYGIDINSSGTHFKEKYEVKDWDKNTPDDEYFKELMRVSKNQIIWGGNYFLDRLGNCKCFIVWDKKIAEDMSFAMCEMAWTSFKNGAKIYKRCRSCHTLEQDGRHSVGPNLWGIYGSKTASKEGYAYSKAMKAADITWDDKTLDEYLKKPAAYLPGTKMTFIGLKKQEDRDALQVFLKKKTEP